jgi:hypothetical protein
MPVDGIVSGEDDMAERLDRLVVALGLLAVLQLLHGLDGLRTDDTETLGSILGDPKSIAGIGGAVLAAWAVATGKAWGRTLAVVTAVLVGLGFLIVHGIPTASERTAPYWGDGSADILEWAGVLAIWATCAAVISLARRRESTPAVA